MKSQIALIGIGLVIAAGVAYAELRPASNTPNAPIVATPQPSSTPTKTKIPTKAKTPAPKISKPSVSGGGGEENDEGNEGND